MFPHLVRVIHDEIVENERQENIALFILERRNMRNLSNPFLLSDTYFKSAFRLTKQMV